MTEIGEVMSEVELLSGLNSVPLNEIVMPQANDVADQAHRAVEASLHSAELLRAQADTLTAIAASYHEEGYLLASDIEERAKRFDQRIKDFMAHVDASRIAFKAEAEKLERFFPKDTA